LETKDAESVQETEEDDENPQSAGTIRENETIIEQNQQIAKLND